MFAFSGGPTAAVSRDHVVSVDPRSGLVFVAGGKWTTYASNLHRL